MVGAMGRLVDKKGFYYLIDAIKELPDTQLLIAGDGPYYEKLKDKIKDISNIEMLGWISNKEDFFKKIDIFCLSSTFEPFGIVLIEAMAAGLPVVCTDAIGNRDLIIEGKNGFMLKKRDPFPLADKIEYLLNNDNVRKKMVEKAILFSENFDIRNYCSRLISIYNNSSANLE